MKAVFFLLLIANIGLFAWHYYQQPDHPTTQAPGSARNGNLILLSESQGTLSVGDAKRDVSACYALKSRGDPAAVAGAADQLRKAGYHPSMRDSIQSQFLGYWVYLPPAATFSDAQIIGQQLSDKGIDDYTFVVGPDKTNAISLGLYADQGAAEARATAVGNLGFRPRVEKRYSKKHEKMLVIGPVDRPPTLKPSGLTWERVDCQASGG